VALPPAAMRPVARPPQSGTLVSSLAADQGRGVFRRASAFFYRHPGAKLAALLTPSLAWFLVFYVAALAVLFVSAFWRVDVFTSQIVHEWGLQNFQQLLNDPVYRTITIRTVGVSVAVTIADIALAFPLAYYAARMARRKSRNAILVAVVLPLWANYVVRVFAWKLILSPGGFLEWLFGLAGIHLAIGTSQWGIWLTFVYLWLPFTFLPIYGALERVSPSYLEASMDLGAKGWLTFRRVIFPLILPGIVAGSIFSFSLTLGDYITPSLLGNTYFIGRVIYESVGVSNNVPFAAAYAFVPALVMVVYLSIAKRFGAFEAL
jgi:putative spermidine/putrescine transport system permease protein